ncbi:MAG: hypothetical protein ACR2QF_16775 [Geminicoccaceae bacterium]
MPFLVKIEADNLIELKKKLMNHLELLDQLFDEANVTVPTVEDSVIAQAALTSNGADAVEANMVDDEPKPTAVKTNNIAPPTREDVANKVKEFIQKQGRTGIAGILAVYDAQRVSDLDVKHYGDVISAIDANLAKNAKEVTA